MSHHVRTFLSRSSKTIKLTMHAVPEPEGIPHKAPVEHEEADLRFESPTKTRGSFDTTCKSVVIMVRSEIDNSDGQAAHFITCSCQVYTYCIFNMDPICIYIVYIQHEYTYCIYVLIFYEF
jgi:hypothetical protein